MSIEAGVQFLFAKDLIYKGFPTSFNNNRLYGDPEMVTVEPVSFYPSTPFHERSVGCAFWAEGCASFNYPRQRKKPEQLRSDLDFRAVLKKKCDFAVSVDDVLSTLKSTTKNRTGDKIEEEKEKKEKWRRRNPNILMNSRNRWWRNRNPARRPGSWCCGTGWANPRCISG